ncbi:MAG: hypothetical protein KJN97_08040 [Deltaproteobacteria bacterium]|nr:hypothetical protein [Deltaproteobacteria bacterium]
MTAPVTISFHTSLGRPSKFRTWCPPDAEIPNGLIPRRRGTELQDPSAVIFESESRIPKRGDQVDGGLQDMIAG